MEVWSVKSAVFALLKSPHLSVRTQKADNVNDRQRTTIAFIR